MNDPQAFRVRKFMRHLLIADKKHRAKERAKEDLEDQIERLKMMLAEKDSGKKYDIEAEMNDLKQKIQNVMEIDAKLLSKDVEREQKSSSMEQSITRLEEKLDDYLRHRENRAQRIEQIEKKIQKRLGLTKEQKAKREFIANVEKRVSEIEDKLIKMKIDGKVGKKKALELRNKIKAYRAKIVKLKGY